MKKVYLTKIEKYLPNEAVSNSEMESILGLVNGNTSKSRAMILRSNQIKSRYYALNNNGEPTHNNAQLCALAIQKLLDEKLSLEDIDLLTAGTSSSDVIQPSHALMIHGELGGPAMEVMSAQGTCNAAMTSLKYAYMSIKSEQAKNAVCTGSEVFSSWMHGRNFDEEIDKRKQLEDNPYIAFEKDFLRWMLSDGAAAVLLQDVPNDNKPSLRIDWIEIKSYASELDSCMYAGGIKNEDGSLTGWRQLSSDERSEQSAFALKQDAKLLQKHIVITGIRLLKDVMQKHQFNEESIDFFLPHISSMFFKKEIDHLFRENGIHFSNEKWFLNLTKVGNVGAASALLMLEELFNSGTLKAGNRILVMVPESARFSHTYMLLTVV